MSDWAEALAGASLAGGVLLKLLMWIWHNTMMDTSTTICMIYINGASINILAKSSFDPTAGQNISCSMIRLMSILNVDYTVGVNTDVYVYSWAQL